MSSEQPALKIENVSKTFSLYEKPIHRLMASLRLLRRPVKKIHGLTDINLQVNRGEVLGVIGRNGAGKSTLLQLICGTLRPTTGNITTHGRIAALLELGAGFNLEFTGRENVKLSAALLGLGPAEIAAKFESIVAFAELEQFIDQPVKTYSSGMFVRLAFAVATSVEPDILVIDEALSVGDGVFARKSFDRIMALKARGTTILFCSHALYQVEALSDRVVWLKDGRVQSMGLAHDVISAYQQFLLQISLDQPPANQAPAQQPATGMGTQPSINRVQLHNTTDIAPADTPVYRSATD
ncbi:MAG: ABC transporter ATP-binding protein, partial [Burkholderiales bacterium]|nr:ABC transporter ATP-binding protein [Burkholderiales bacterium]